MKRLIATYPNDVEINIGELLTKSIDFKVETIGAEAAKGPTRKRKANGLGVPETIMTHYTARGEFSLVTAQTWLEKVGFNPTSAHGAMARLISKGYIERGAGDVFRYKKPLTGKFTMV